MLVTRPNHDVTTNYLYLWSRAVIDCAKKFNKTIIDLVGKRANNKEFNSIVKKTNPDLLFLNGHGDEETITGFDNEPLISLSENIEILKGKIIFARSCKSAKKLGKEAVKNGCKAYLGYDDDFVFMADDDFILRPLMDKIAEMFLKPSNQVVISMIKGNTAGEADIKSKELFKKNAQRLMTSTAPKDQKDLIPYLLWDYNHQVCLGDTKAKIYQKS
jgi:hypothetical protein